MSSRSSGRRQRVTPLKLPGVWQVRVLRSNLGHATELRSLADRCNPATLATATAAWEEEWEEPEASEPRNLSSSASMGWRMGCSALPEWPQWQGYRRIATLASQAVPLFRPMLQQPALAHRGYRPKPAKTLRFCLNTV